MNINEIYLTVNNELFKHQTGNAYSADDFNLRLKSANIDLLKQRYGLPEEYRPGSPIPKMNWEETQKIIDDLKFAKVHMGVETAPLYINKLGFATLPTDYLHQSTIYSIDSDIEILGDDEFSYRLKASLKKPTKKNAICRFISNKIQFAPLDIRNVEFTYLRMPIDPFRDFTIQNDADVYLDENGVHDGSVLPAGTPSRTVQLEWPIQTHIDFLNLMVGYAAKSLRIGFLTQTTERRKDKGI